MNKVKTLDDLRKMRESLRTSLDLREKSNNPEQMVQIKVAMATCGIAAGARPVMNAFVEELAKRNITNATVSMTGCIGMCRLEPIVEVLDKDDNKVTYVKMTAEKAARVVAEHIVNGNIVTEYTIGAVTE